MITLPKEKTKPSCSLSKLSMLIYGAPKIGKSTFCSRIDKALFIATEPGLNYLETYNVRVNTWLEFLEVMAALKREEHPFEVIVIDTIDRLCDFCDTYICEQAKVQTISDVGGYGKGYALFKTEMNRVFQKIFAMNLGVVITSHTVMAEVPTPSGKQIQYQPSVQKRIQDIIIPLVDIIGFAHSISAINKDGECVEARVLETAETTSWVAGDRTGRLPATLPFNFHVFKKYFMKSEDKPKSEAAERAAAISEEILAEDAEAQIVKPEPEPSEDKTIAEEVKPEEVKPEESDKSQPKTTKRAAKKGE